MKNATRSVLLALAPALLGVPTLAACSSGSTSGNSPPDAGSPGPTSDAGDAAATPPYPAGPYGTTVGSTLPPTLAWQGFAPGATSASTIRITDLYDPDGSKGINALLMDTSAQWCVPCQGEATSIPRWMSSSGPGAANWSALGAQVLTLVIQNVAMTPASVTTAQQWRSMFDLTDIYVVADPSVTFAAQGVPYNVLVDPRTMKITTDFSNSTLPGDDGGGDAGDDGGPVDPAFPEVAQLATHNKK
jgi:hypothetical protein